MDSRRGDGREMEFCTLGMLTRNCSEIVEDRNGGFRNGGACLGVWMFCEMMLPRKGSRTVMTTDLFRGRVEGGILISLRKGRSGWGGLVEV